MKDSMLTECSDTEQHSFRHNPAGSLLEIIGRGIRIDRMLQ